MPFVPANRSHHRPTTPRPRWNSWIGKVLKEASLVCKRAGGPLPLIGVGCPSWPDCDGQVGLAGAAANQGVRLPRPSPIGQVGRKREREGRRARPGGVDWRVAVGVEILLGRCTTQTTSLPWPCDMLPWPRRLGRDGYLQPLWTQINHLTFLKSLRIS
jgi:hypothetical protein